jgi:hypothetical protein
VLQLLLLLGLGLASERRLAGACVRHAHMPHRVAWLLLLLLLLVLLLHGVAWRD